jgi:adenylate cyclase
MGEAEQVRRLERFLSPQVTRFILSCDERERLQCRHREITVVFCDLRGFTSFAECAAPEDVTTVLTGVHGRLRRARLQAGGARRPRRP